MELSGLQIFKYLPGSKKLPESNCKKCGFPTCMAFALKLAKNAAVVENCPYAPEDLREVFKEASKVKQYEIALSDGIKIGGETVMFRHEKTFVNKTVIGISLNSGDCDFDVKLSQIKQYENERVGEIFKVDAIYLKDGGNLKAAAEKVIKSGFALIVETDNNDAEIEGNIVRMNKNNEYSANSETVVATGNNADKIGEVSAKLLKSGFKKLILDLDMTGKTMPDILTELTIMRRSAITDKNENFAYPVMTRLSGDDVCELSAKGSLLICHYSGILIFDVFNEALLNTLFTLRQNIYTDPQKPLQVESKIYELNSPDKNAIAVMTTNFALTYFAVLNELEATGMPIYLIILPSDGLSVLTAWSADKFTPEIAASMVKKSDVLNNLSDKRLVIPGLLSHIRDEIAQELPEWEIITGTNEAYKIQDFMKETFAPGC